MIYICFARKRGFSHENCSYNTLRFIFIILLPVKAAWSHDDDDDDDDDDDFFFFFFFF